MLKVKIGLSKRKKVPVFYILDSSYLPHKAVAFLLRARRMGVIEQKKLLQLNQTLKQLSA